MKKERTGILIGAIMTRLNANIRAQNKRLAAENLHWNQKPLHGADTFFKLAYMSDSEIRKIAVACGL